jgi:hypothetical protein
MRRFSREAGSVALLLSALAVVVYGRNVLDGGFLSDGWTNRSIYVFGGLEGLFDEPNIAVRPLYGFYLVVLNGAFDGHSGLWLGWLLATSVLMSWVLYLLLRKLDFEFLDAMSIGALVLVFPAASSLRLWVAAVQIPVSVSLAIFGFLVAFLAFDARGARRLALHGVSLILFVTSLLFYEAAVPLILCSVLLYRLRVPWSRAARRWVADVVVLVAVTAAVAGSVTGAKELQGWDGMWHHAVTILDQAWTLLATVVLPFDSDSWYLLVPLGLVPLTAVFLAWRLPADAPGRPELLRWLAVLLSGLFVVVLGYAVFVPGSDYYVPLGHGIANRVNAVPSIGWVLVLYALIRLAAAVAFRRAAASLTLSARAALVACVVVGVGWANSVSRDVDAYTTATRETERVLATIDASLLDPPPGSTIWALGQPVEIVPGIPVFGNTWDMTAGVQLLYGDPTISSYVGYPDTSFDCRSDAIVPGGSSYPMVAPGISRFASSYFRTYFVHTTTGQAAAIRTRRTCRKAAASFPRSPYLAGEPAPAAPPEPHPPTMFGPVAAPLAHSLLSTGCLRSSAAQVAEMSTLVRATIECGASR